MALQVSIDVVIDFGELPLQVFHGGKRVDYLGALVKRPAPTEADLVVFQPYETKVVTVDLGQAYDLGKTGEYTVSFQSFLDGARTDKGRRLAGSNGRMASLQSVPLKLWVDADNQLKALKGGATDSETIQKNYAAVSGATNGTECKTYKDCVDLLKKGTDIDYVGQSGPADLNSTGSPSKATIGIQLYDANNQYKQVDSVSGVLN